MKLKELLKKITPLPWSKNGGVLMNVTQGPVKGDWNKAYCAHAANAIQTLVESLHDMLADAVKYPQLELCDHHKQRLIEIISHAENVKMPNVES